MGFKGSRKGTPFAAQQAADSAAKKAMDHGLADGSNLCSGSWSRTRIRSPCIAIGWDQYQLDQGRNSDSSQWLPSAETQTRLITK